MKLLSQVDPRWMSIVLWTAAIYNVAFGAWVMIWPHAWFDLSDMPRPAYPQIWQCVGMIVGVYGVGYAIAATSPTRWWPIVLVGLLGKLFGPIGFALAIGRGELPLSMGWIIVTNDLIWWAPFSGILLRRLHLLRQECATGDRRATSTGPWP